MYGLFNGSPEELIFEIFKNIFQAVLGTTIRPFNNFIRNHATMFVAHAVGRVQNEEVRFRLKFLKWMIDDLNGHYVKIFTILCLQICLQILHKES